MPSQLDAPLIERQSLSLARSSAGARTCRASAHLFIRPIVAVNVPTRLVNGCRARRRPQGGASEGQSVDGTPSAPQLQSATCEWSLLIIIGRATARTLSPSAAQRLQCQSRWSPAPQKATSPTLVLPVGLDLGGTAARVIEQQQADSQAVVVRSLPAIDMKRDLFDDIPIALGGLTLLVAFIGGWVSYKAFTDQRETVRLTKEPTCRSRRSRRRAGSTSRRHMTTIIFHNFGPTRADRFVLEESRRS